jgi:hypothetical protein
VRAGSLVRLASFGAGVSAAGWMSGCTNWFIQQV